MPPVLGHGDGLVYRGRFPEFPVGPYDLGADYFAGHWLYVKEDVEPSFVGELREKYGALRDDALCETDPEVPDAFFFNEQIFTQPWHHTEFIMPDSVLDGRGDDGICDPDGYYVTSGFINPTANPGNSGHSSDEPRSYRARRPYLPSSMAWASSCPMSGSTSQYSGTPNRSYRRAFQCWSRSRVEGDRISTTTSGTPSIARSVMMCFLDALTITRSGSTTLVSSKMTSTGASKTDANPLSSRAVIRACWRRRDTV